VTPASTSQKCEVVPKRARVQGSWTFVSLKFRLESNKEEEEKVTPAAGRVPKPLNLQGYLAHEKQPSPPRTTIGFRVQSYCWVLGGGGGQ
jgi:hypothetical protein